MARRGVTGPHYLHSHSNQGPQSRATPGAQGGEREAMDWRRAGSLLPGA